MCQGRGINTARKWAGIVIRKVRTLQSGKQQLQSGGSQKNTMIKTFFWEHMEQCADVSFFLSSRMYFFFTNNNKVPILGRYIYIYSPVKRLSPLLYTLISLSRSPPLHLTLTVTVTVRPPVRRPPATVLHTSKVNR